MGKMKFKNIRNQFYWIPRLNIYITKSIKKKCVTNYKHNHQLDYIYNIN